LAHYGHIADIPSEAADWDPGVRQSVRGAAKLAERLAAERDRAELFTDLATLRVDPSLLGGTDSLRWNGPTSEFVGVCGHFRDPGMAERAAAISAG
jgi:hypothetical protein